MASSSKTASGWGLATHKKNQGRIRRLELSSSTPNLWEEGAEAWGDHQWSRAYQSCWPNKATIKTQKNSVGGASKQEGTGGLCPSHMPCSMRLFVSILCNIRYNKRGNLSVFSSSEATPANESNSRKGSCKPQFMGSETQVKSVCDLHWRAGFWWDWALIRGIWRYFQVDNVRSEVNQRMPGRCLLQGYLTGARRKPHMGVEKCSLALLYSQTDFMELIFFLVIPVSSWEFLHWVFKLPIAIKIFSFIFKISNHFLILWWFLSHCIPFSFYN